MNIADMVHNLLNRRFRNRRKFRYGW